MKEFYTYPNGIGPVYVNTVGQTKYLVQGKDNQTIICAYNGITKTTKRFMKSPIYDIVIDDFCLDYDFPYPSESAKDPDNMNDIYKLQAHIVDTYYGGNIFKFADAQYKEMKRVLV